jgi:hypothetical protein
VYPDDGLDSHVGSKCQSLWKISKKLGSTVAVPSALALPFGALHQVLAMPQNAQIASALQRADAIGDVAVELMKQVTLQHID